MPSMVFRMPRILLSSRHAAESSARSRSRALCSHSRCAAVSRLQASMRLRSTCFSKSRSASFRAWFVSICSFRALRNSTCLGLYLGFACSALGAVPEAAASCAPHSSLACEVRRLRLSAFTIPAGASSGGVAPPVPPVPDASWRRRLSLASICCCRNSEYLRLCAWRSASARAAWTRPCWRCPSSSSRSRNASLARASSWVICLCSASW
mmetsp:Transcript_13351/g.37924  ORF Transcript_13351/g.37924 Transcript_13351/m.37924 type:complete len:209 (+) Transcript_13351:281-907(+)